MKPIVGKVRVAQLLLLCVVGGTAARADNSPLPSRWFGTVIGRDSEVHSSESHHNQNFNKERRSTDGVFVLTIPEHGQATYTANGSSHWVLTGHSENVATCQGGGTATSTQDSSQEGGDSEPFAGPLGSAMSSPVSIAFMPDGTYQFSILEAMNLALPTVLKGGAHSHNGCGESPDSFLDLTTQMTLGTGSPRYGSGTAPKTAQTLADSARTDNSGHPGDAYAPGGTSWDSNHSSVQWSLRLKASPLHARMTQSVYTVQRGDQVTLDATPSQGAITEYDWRLYSSADCSDDVPLQTDMKGKTVTFTALCGLTVALAVKNDQDTDLTAGLLTVTPRAGWTTPASQIDTEGQFTSFVSKQHATVGKNRCAVDTAEPNHWIHHAVGNNSWDGEGYVVKQIQEAGAPFDQMWYVQQNKLKIQRQAFINASLLPGGAVGKLNSATSTDGNPDDLARLIRQIRAHESLHTSLVRDYVNAEGPAWDPATQIETHYAKSHSQLTQDADGIVIAAEDALNQTDWEAMIKAQLAQVPEFKLGGWIQVGVPNGGGHEIWQIDSFAGLDM